MLGAELLNQLRNATQQALLMVSVKGLAHPESSLRGIGPLNRLSGDGYRRPPGQLLDFRHRPLRGLFFLPLAHASHFGTRSAGRASLVPHSAPAAPLCQFSSLTWGLDAPEPE